MSTTYGSAAGLVYIDDAPDDILRKLKRAQTDSGSEIVRAPDKPGITNLIEMLAVVRGTSPEAVEAEFDGQGYGTFKQAVGEGVVELLAPVRERYQELRADPEGARGDPGRGSRACPRDRHRHDARRARRDGHRPEALTRREASDPRSSLSRMPIAALDLDLEVFHGPFDLLLTLVLSEEVDLLEVELADVVLAYVEHLERSGELDLEAATEFLVLIAALLELKSRLMLPVEDEEELDLEPQEAAEELLARMLEYHRYREAARHLHERLAEEQGFRYRSAPLPPVLRRVSIEVAEAAYDPERLAEAIGDLLRVPEPLDLRHVRRPAVSVEQRLRHLRDLLRSRAALLLRRGRGGRRPADRGGHALRPARAVQGGRGQVGAGGAVRPDHGGAVVKDLARIVEALLFLSPEPVAVDRLADACEVGEGEVVEALARLREHYAEGYRGVVLREVAGGFTLATDPVAEHAARRLLAKPRTPPLTQAQAECLGIVAYLQPVSRPEIARIRGVASESAVGTLLERGLIEESGRSRFGAVMYRSTELFQKLFGLSGLDELPDPARFDPSPEDEGELRERLARAGEQRAQGTTG